VIEWNEWRTEKRHECANMGKVKRLELWWQLCRTSLPVWDLENFRPMDFCWHECTCSTNSKSEKKFQLCKILFERSIFVTEITYLLAKFWFTCGYVLVLVIFTVLCANIFISIFEARQKTSQFPYQTNLFIQLKYF